MSAVLKFRIKAAVLSWEKMEDFCHFGWFKELAFPFNQEMSVKSQRMRKIVRREKVKFSASCQDSKKTITYCFILFYFSFNLSIKLFEALRKKC